MSMFNTALYYPYIDIDDPRWLRSAILFWEHIQTIVPSEVERPYRRRETRLARDAGLISPLICDLHGELLEDMSRRVLRFAENPESLNREVGEIYGADPLDSLPSGDLGASSFNSLARARLHRQKMAPPLLTHFAEVEVDPDGFLHLEGPFARFYMSALATRLARDTGTVAVSSEPDVFAYQVSTALDEVVSRTASAAPGLMTSVVIESLAIDASTPIEHVIRFRRENETRLRELTNKFEELTAKFEKAEGLREMREKASRHYSRQIRPELERLRESLIDASVGARWNGFRNTVALSATAGGAAAAFLGCSTEFALGAGAFATVLDVGIQAHLANNKIRRDNAYSYLLDVERRFTLPRRFTD